jgi:hypothetical protein
VCAPLVRPSLQLSAEASKKELRRWGRPTLKPGSSSPVREQRERAVPYPERLSCLLRLSVLANQLMNGKANGDDACTRSLRANCSDRLSHAQISVPSALAAQLPASELAS